ncbi:LysR family transcriptional regulator [Actinomadura namibiensis]|uniref:DNA-binding transcriptional LysR family regulator n=1 Tax=Actinomadura namibiensis TaxID=182080 RepID=A0A7W3QRU5_ACTNM|nr:LysR substrate-binding domain-containing protein [Actinomadura namibiensis]MBA8957134.1 DNA-binding transcriptional LysR family regulator [Actinomadura namibiensis]
MNLVGHLNAFVAVAEELHFGRAAERLGMAQPPLSQRIQRLERELGVRLFDRSSRRVELTAAGRMLLEEARDILERVERVHTLAERARLGETGALRAGLPPDLGGAVVAALISAFRDRRPEVRLDLREIGTTGQAQALADGTLDVGVLRHPCDGRALAFGPMLAQRIGALLPADRPVDGPLHVADLAGDDLVTTPREEAPGPFDEMLAVCRRHGYDPPNVHEARNTQFALGLVLAGTAVALTPRVQAPGVTWHPLAGDPLNQRVSCAWRRDDDSPDIAAFTETATAVLCAEADMTPLSASSPTRRVVPRPAFGFLA